MAIVVDRKLGRRFAKTLGLDPGKVRTITLSLEPQQPVIATIEMYPDEKEVELLEMELKRYKLVEKK